MGEIVSWSYIPYELGHCWWKSIAIGIFNRGTTISHGIKSMCHIGWSKGHMIRKIGHNISFSGKLTYVIFSYSMSIDHIIWGFITQELKK